jgi:hypothetical protein
MRRLRVTKNRLYSEQRKRTWASRIMKVEAGQLKNTRKQVREKSRNYSQVSTLVPWG